MSYKPVDVAITMVVGPCIDDTDFKTLEEAIAHNAAGMDVSLIVEKTDGTTGVTAINLTTGGTSDWTHKDGGYYEIEVTAAQNAEEGVGYIRGVCTGVLPFESAHYNIVKANVYDSWVKGTDVLQADITQLGGVAQSLTDLKDFADAGYNPGTNKITGTADMRGTDSANTTVPDAAGVAPTAVEIRQEMDTNSTKMAPSQVLADYKATGFSTHNAAAVWSVATRILTASTNFNDLTAAEMKAEVVAALADIKLDHLLNIAVDTNWATTVHLDSVIGHMADVGTAATFNRTTDALEALRNRGDAAWIAATGFSTHSAADVKTAVEQAGSSLAQILADTGELQTNQGAWATATGFSTHNAAAVKTAIEAGGSSLAQILADTGELQTDWVNGGRLDLILDIIAADTTTDIPGLIATAQADLKRILGLDQENFYIDNPVFTGVHMTSCRIRLYSVAGSVGTAADVLATYTMTATYSGDNLATYKMVKA